jgi:UDP-N-acetylmuramyl pentapeptide phosphotransferase/UDP-N-acetylglucosamine-1-phosphate transferase
LAAEPRLSDAMINFGHPGLVDLWAFAIAVLLSLVLMPVGIVLGRHYHMVTKARLFKRSRSQRRVSYLGGLAVALSATLATFIAGGVVPTTISVAGGMLVLAVCFFDNASKKPRPVFSRIYMEGVVAAGVWVLGFRQQFPGPAGALVAVAVLVAAANAFNWLDNMNGVAGATTVVTGVGIAALAYLTSRPELAAPAAAVCGSTLAFLRYNWGRARVFLGAGGPEFIGFVLGATALQVCSVFGYGWALVAVGTFLAVPAIDCVTAIGSRMLLGKPPFKGGLDHLSHRLVRLGHSTRATAFYHALWAAAGSAAVLLAWRTGPELLVPALFIFVMGAVSVVVADMSERRAGKFGRRLAIGFVLAFAAIGVSVAPAVIGAGLDLYGARKSFNQGMQLVSAFKITDGKAAFHQGGELAARAKIRLSSPLTLPARVLPVIGDNLKAAIALADGVSLLAPAAEEALSASEAFPQGPAGPILTLNQGHIDTRPWPEAEARLNRATAGVRIALAGMGTPSQKLLPPLSGVTEGFVQTGRRALKALESAQSAAGLVPFIFGADRPHTWFLAIQNPVEQRATGGFLGAFGILHSDHGSLKLERFDSNARLPVVPKPASAPPEYIEQFDRFGSRSTWSNVNMTPDFPTVAAVMSGMWRNATGSSIDGVIAIDAVGLGQLLDVVGPVSVDPVGEISSENFLPLALNEAYIRFPLKPDRADFLLQVGKEVWSRLLSGSFPNPGALVGPLGRTVAGRHLQMWMPEQEARVEQLGLDGRLAPTGKGDFLMVVGQNAAGNKVDYYARRAVSYNVDLSNPSTVKKLVRVEVQNGAPSSGLPQYILGPTVLTDPPGMNRTFTSIYTPKGAGIVSAQVDGKPVTMGNYLEQGLGVLTRFVETLPGRTSQLQLQMQSRLETPGNYRLFIRHQPNLYPDRLTLDVTLPAGTFVLSASPGLKANGNQVHWEGSLDGDAQFFIRYGFSYHDRADQVLAANSSSAQ